MKFKEALNLLKKHISDKARIDHCIKSSEFAEKIAIDINKNNGADLDVDFIKICSLLHDIGRSEIFPGKEHATNGGNIMRKLGHDKIAEVIETHSHAQEKNEYLGDKTDLIQKTIEQKIITYVDMHIGPGGKMFKPKERITDILKRRKGKPEHTTPVIKSKERLLQLCDEIGNMVR